MTNELLICSWYWSEATHTKLVCKDYWGSLANLKTWLIKKCNKRHMKPLQKQATITWLSSCQDLDIYNIMKNSLFGSKSSLNIVDPQGSRSAVWKAQSQCLYYPLIVFIHFSSLQLNSTEKQKKERSLLCSNTYKRSECRNCTCGKESKPKTWKAAEQEWSINDPFFSVHFLWSELCESNNVAQSSNTD